MYKDITIELIGGLLALLIMLKLLGKIQFSQITPFDFITALVLGNFVGDAIFDNNAGLREIYTTSSLHQNYIASFAIL